VKSMQAPTHDIVSIMEFRAFGDRLTHNPAPLVTGTYKVDQSEYHFKQTGLTVTGCFYGATRLIEGGLEGRLLRFTWQPRTTTAPRSPCSDRTDSCSSVIGARTGRSPSIRSWPRSRRRKRATRPWSVRSERAAGSTRNGVEGDAPNPNHPRSRRGHPEDQCGSEDSRSKGTPIRRRRRSTINSFRSGVRSR
jgi:hypothetical protein